MSCAALMRFGAASETEMPSQHPNTDSRQHAVHISIAAETMAGRHSQALHVFVVGGKTHCAGMDYHNSQVRLFVHLLLI